jgi:hypothetical protein
MKHLLPLLPMLICMDLAGQVRVDGSIVLSGSELNVNGLATSAPADALLPLGLERSGQHRFATASGTGTWNVVLEALPNGPGAGTSLLILPPDNASGPVLISMNGGPASAVLRSPEDTLISEAIPAGSVLHIVHDGTAFQLMNGDQDLDRTCPDGSVIVGDRICTEVSERGAATFEGAALTCAGIGARLCSWADLVAACLQRDELGLLQMTNNLEWTASTANEDGSARVALGSTCLQLGAANTATASYTFRCCTTR